MPPFNEWMVHVYIGIILSVHLAARPSEIRRNYFGAKWVGLILNLVSGFLLVHLYNQGIAGIA